MNHLLVEMLKRTGAVEGSAVCIQSSLRGIESGKIEAGEIIQTVQAFIGDRGTLIMPAYNFHAWTEQKEFDYHNTPSEVGALTEFFRKSQGVMRTEHPIHSLSVWGTLAKDLCAINAINSFGNNSVFASMLRSNIIYLTLGTGLAMPFLPCHHTEHRLGVGYRRLKMFKGHYIDAIGVKTEREYGFDVKKDEFRQVVAPVYAAHIDLHRSGVVKMDTVGTTQVCWARAKEYDDGFAGFMQSNPHLFNN